MSDAADWRLFRRGQMKTRLRRLLHLCWLAAGCTATLLLLLVHWTGEHCCSYNGSQLSMGRPKGCSDGRLHSAPHQRRWTEYDGEERLGSHQTTDKTKVQTSSPTDDVKTTAIANELGNENVGRSPPHAAADRGKFILSFRYYEQLGGSTRNFLALASLAKHGARSVIAPYVSNSRMSGLPHGASTRTNNLEFGAFSQYFDVADVNRTLREHGYATLETLHTFEANCQRRLNVLVHFIFSGDNAQRMAFDWYKLNSDEYENVKARTRQNGGWSECDFLARLKTGVSLKGFTVERNLCVDPEIIKDPQLFEGVILRHAKCVGLVQWRGNGTSRTHFPLHPDINDPLKPSDLKHNRRLIDIAIGFVKRHLKRPFISVHIRAERHVLRRRINDAMSCVRRLARRVTKRRTMFKLENVFLASDLIDNGSGTFVKKGNSTERKYLQTYVRKKVGTSLVFDPIEANITDTGKIAIIEMYILSMGDSLFTLGGGTFQDWGIDLFLSKNAEDSSLVQRVCILP